MKHISLFSGIGGFCIAADWMGWTNVASCEWASFPTRVMKKHYPNIYHHSDIKTLTGRILDEEITQRFGKEWRADGVILTGGFPCQPFSQTGLRQGSNDDRYLWPEMLRIICEIQPDHVVAENVSGLFNWNRGLVFEKVCADMETQGYQVQPFDISATSIGADHQRERLWFVANTNKQLGTERYVSTKPIPQKQSGRLSNEAFWSQNRWPLESAILRMDDGVSDRLDESR